MTTTTDTGPHPTARLDGSGRTFVALLQRDLHVLLRGLNEFLPRTLLQPLLLVFVFTYVFPKIGQGIGGQSEAAQAAFSTLLVAGVIGTSILFQGIQSTALPLVQEFGYTREIEDRVLAPLPVELVAVEKIVAGALQCLLAGLIVFPIAAVVPVTTPELAVNWPVLVTMIPLSCLFAAALGLTFGTIFEPRTVPLLFGVIVIPMTFLGCVYYPWQDLEAIRWLQIAVLVNPLVYVTEGFRAALTESPHMPLWVIYSVLVITTVGFGVVSVRSFIRRVVA